MKLLVLVPTLPELDIVEPVLRSAVEKVSGQIEVCGFGIAAAAARSSQLIGLLRPEKVLLLGIAGGLDPALPIGSAWRFDTVNCYGIGVGQGEGFLSAAKLGWPQLPFQPSHRSVPELSLSGDRLQVGWEGKASGHRVLVTVTAGSQSPVDVQNVLADAPGAHAEDMEGFGVALSCQLFGVPLEIVRGISNTAGNRDKSLWRIRESLHTAADLCQQLISSL